MEKKQHKLTKALYIIGILLLIAAIGLFVGGMTAAEWDFTKLSTVRYVQRNYTQNEEITLLKIEYSNADIKIVYRQDQQGVGISYPVRIDNNDKDIATIDFAYSQSDGSLTVTENLQKRSDLFNWDLSSPVLTVTLPADNVCSLDLSSESGSIHLESDLQIQLTSLSLHSDNGNIYANANGGISVSGETVLSDENGNITIKNLNAVGALKAQTENGNITLSSVTAQSVTAATENGKVIAENVAAAEKFTATSDNGNITFSGNIQTSELICIADNGNIHVDENAILSAQSLTFTLENGDLNVRGALAGKREDYTVNLQLQSGTANISHGGSGQKTLNLSAENGDITVRFEQ